VFSPQFLGSELPRLAPSACRFQVIPVPYEASVSYGAGAGQGPVAILEASQQLEVWTGRGTPSERGIFTWPPVDCEGTPQDVLQRIEAATTRALLEGRNCAKPGSDALPVPVLLGGEHTITLGALRALAKQGMPLGVVQFDAHADLRDTYEGNPYSHACVMRRVTEDIGLPIFQVGVRSLSPMEVVFRAERNIPHLDARELHMFRQNPLPMHPAPSAPTANVSLLPKDFPEHVFLTFDIDALDASLMPATGTPEPGGLFWWDALELVRNCLAGRHVVGCDLTEFAPIPGMHAPAYTAARLAYEIMGLIPFPEQN
jgi:agmatinase